MCRLKRVLKGSGIFIGVFIILLFCGYHYFFVSMKSLPRGEFVHEYPSPRSFYSIHIYEASEGWIRGEFVDNLTNMKRNVLWGPLSGEVEWLDEENVVIDGIQLNVLRDQYDYRRESRK